MHEPLNNPSRQDLSDRYGRAMNIIGQLDQILGDIARYAHTVKQAQRWAEQGQELVATLGRIEAADPDVPAQRPAHRHTVGTRIDNNHATELGARWGGGI